MASLLNDVNPETPGSEIGIFIRKGGAITLDAAVVPCFKFLMVTTQGSIVVQHDGANYTIPVAVPGVVYPCLGTKVISSGTTATGIYWLTGS